MRLDKLATTELQSLYVELLRRRRDHLMEAELCRKNADSALEVIFARMAATGSPPERSKTPIGVIPPLIVLPIFGPPGDRPPIA